jgi:hypothetical protein
MEEKTWVAICWDNDKQKYYTFVFNTPEEDTQEYAYHFFKTKIDLEAWVERVYPLSIFKALAEYIMGVNFKE